MDRISVLRGCSCALHTPKPPQTVMRRRQRALRSPVFRRGLLLALLGIVLLILRAAVTRTAHPSGSVQLLSAAKAAKAAPTDRHGSSRASRLGGKGSGGSRASGAGKGHAPAKATPTPAILAKGELAAKLQEAMREQVMLGMRNLLASPPRISNPPGCRMPMRTGLAVDQISALHTSACRSLNPCAASVLTRGAATCPANPETC